ncbi:MAG: hypothetical protein OEU90_00330 [Gammaproteobacteria bacterium]|nr:hypothetical protein [Gammaproteobacteria bacterium]MDH3749224.1 hypothetical protein [Gammaproteobacteria bacterium]MDH3803893.1 hypothetical protein [Gammaproteobacteria bacterium]
MSVRLRNERLVVTLATIPSRVSKIRPVIDSIKAQTRKPDQIYICICKFCAWEQSSYDVPEWLAEDGEVQLVVSRRDYGPANKLLSMLHEEPNPATRIVIVDDDWSYNPDMLEVLQERFEHYQRCAIGSSGARLPRKWSVMEARIGPEIHATPQMRHHLIFVAESPEDHVVDILQFGFGAMVLREWFDDDIYDLVQPLEPLYFSDDVMFSGYLESKGVKRVCVSGMPLPRLLDHWNVRPLHGEGRATRNYKAAIPEISSTLNIWSPETLFNPPRPPALSVLKYWALRAIRKAHRVAIRPLLRRAGLPAVRERK